MKKVLIVDDDKGILESLQMMLEIEGYKVFTTPKGEEACDKVREFDPDLMILDVLLSGVDGRMIAKELRCKNKTKDLPIIMITAHPNIEDEIMRCGANDFLPKPFEMNMLLSKIENLM